MKEITLAVFPFANLSEVDAYNLFCQSFSLDLITELSRFRQFNLIAFDSTRRFEMLQSEEAASTPPLEADYFIRGAFRSDGDTLWINAQLINAHSNFLVWADRFEGNASAISALQEDLLREIVSSLQQQLDMDLLAQLRKKPAVRLAAYEFWLRGMEALRKGALASDIEARTFFQKALDIDPGYALAYSGMSLTYFNEWSCQLWERWEVSKNGAYEWALKAIELDDQNYVAAFVLGRTLLYSGDYARSEHYLRKALRLNPNDTSNLVQIASCLTYLGYPKEAEQIYQKVLRINPLQETRFNQIGAFIRFELGDFQQCIELGKKAPQGGWVDFQAYMAAAYYHLGQHQPMRACWKQYLADIAEKIEKGAEWTEAQALRWMMDVNPYRGGSPMRAFWEYIGHAAGASSLPSLHSPDTETGVFEKEGGIWILSYGGSTVRIPERKGFFDIARLLRSPNEAVHCSELIGMTLSASKEPLFDEKAKKAYQRKILDLQEALREAESANDSAGAARLQREYDELLDFLSKSLGIGGKVRTAGDPAEKARAAVTWRIRKAIQQIEQVHPGLAKHLSNSIKTGIFCSYSPETPVSWQ